MCWNENVSLNTFLFGTVVLLFIAYNNSYTQYKIIEFDKYPILYLFMFSVVSMQLAEYFLWKSIRTKNEEMNTIFSMMGWSITRIFQPLFAIGSIPDPFIYFRNVAFVVYFFTLTVVSTYKQLYNPIDFKSIIDKSGHLRWIWDDITGYEKIQPFFYFLSLFVLVFHFPVITLLSACYLIVSYFMFKNAWGSMWCWIINSFFIYFLIDILYIMPYKEYMKV